MSALLNILDTFRREAKSEREKGTYFEELILVYLRNEASYKDLYDKVWTYADWAKEQGLDQRDAGIDLVARTAGTGEFHAIQCKLYTEDYKLQKKDIDSFFTASGKSVFSHRIIVSTTNNWSDHAEEALKDQQPPVSKIDLFDLENSQIDWSKYQSKQEPVLKPKKQLREHQKEALRAVKAGLKTADRGKLIMACGTGKTFTSLKIAEEIAGKGGRVLFLVPSLALLSQTLTEWTQESSTLIHSFAVCSDSDVGKKKRNESDEVKVLAHELRYPATTNAKSLAKEVDKRSDSGHMSVIFSTYHSIDVISDAQKEYGLADFDLIICDEAHRTTGATFEKDKESNFVRVHDADFIKSAKRLYMTATPRVYGDAAKIKANSGAVTLCSMDDEELYGKTLYVITFSEAVARELLVDYKVIVLAVEESYISRKLQALLNDGTNQLKVDDAAKIVGCWKALAKQGINEELTEDAEAMKRAVAFCQVIEPALKSKTHKVSSKNIASMFQAVVEAYQEAESIEPAARLNCEADHVDGSMNASEKEAKLAWLKADTPESTCRILSNVRCLSEGVDVPALDAVLFLTPRNSQIDVVQSVGRVMRKAEGKKRGYVILPVVIPAGVEPHDALNDNLTYRVVWQVLQALRSHDDRFDAMINKLELNGYSNKKIEVIAITGDVKKKTKTTAAERRKRESSGQRQYGIGSDADLTIETFMQPEIEIGDLERAIYAKLVQKCGRRVYWAEWASDIAKIARTHIDRIKAILENSENVKAIEAFEAFANELRDDLNDSITDEEIIEMLAQHLITKPVFDALFDDYNFTEHNPISQAMQGILEALQEKNISKEADTLQQFYESVKMRAEGIDSAEGKQKIVLELYDKFFRNAFPRMTERLGIVYTPVEVVDFIIRSVNDVLQSEFKTTLGSKGVHIIDPFTGTGTFITRLLQSGLITKEELEYKYKNEIHANEIVLLAYYIAAINIEAVYHALAGGEYTPFEGICLTDTFAMYEKDDLISDLLEDNSNRRNRQKKLDIRVIIGNPPYSIGQKSENDNNDNVVYPALDEKIRSSYAEMSKSVTTKGLYDNYIRAIRWASNRIGDCGVIGFISGSGFIEKPTMDGMRKCLAEEFSNIYILNLRGDIRKNMLSNGKAKEGQNIFDSNSMTGTAITILIKNPENLLKGQVNYYDIGDDLTTKEKRVQIVALASINEITKEDKWQRITPNKHGDWLGQRDDTFSKFIVLGDKRGDALKVFNNFSQGLLTARDAWCYNASFSSVSENMKRMIEFYSSELNRFNAQYLSAGRKEREERIDGFINIDPVRISWTTSLKQELIRGNNFIFESNSVTHSLYRPFTKMYVYYDKVFNHRVSQMPKIFPNGNAKNIVICFSGVGARSGFSVLISNTLPSYDNIEKGQCFPLYLYDEDGSRRDAITDEGLAHFQAAYPNEKITKEDLFYYIYGLLHSPEYREKYADNLSKELPRIPCVKNAADFWAFSKAGRALADLHINYETVAKYPATIEKHSDLTDEDYRVEKMKYGKNKDKTTIIYNHKITVKNIPLEAYEYVVNGKSAIDWVVERQCVKTDKASGIVNDANDWAVETMNNPKYPLELLLRVITVSLETMKVVNSLPKLGIE